MLLGGRGSGRSPRAAGRAISSSSSARSRAAPSGRWAASARARRRGRRDGRVARAVAATDRGSRRARRLGARRLGAVDVGASARGGSPCAPSASPSGSWTIRVGGAGASTGSGSSEPVRPVRFRSPVGRARVANGSTTSRSGRAARSAVGTPSAKALSSASSYSSIALGRGPPDPGAGGHRERRAASGRPSDGRRWPRTRSAWIAATRRLDRGRRRPDVAAPAATAARRRRAAPPVRARWVARRRGGVSGTRSSHLPTRVSSIGAVGRGVGQFDDEHARPRRAAPGGPRRPDRRPAGRRHAAGPRRIDQGSSVRMVLGGRLRYRAADHVATVDHARSLVPDDRPLGARTPPTAPRRASLAGRLGAVLGGAIASSLTAPAASAAVAPDLIDRARRPRAAPARRPTAPLRAPRSSAALDRLARPRRRCPGVSVAILFPDGTTWLGTSGMADVAARTPVTAGDRLRASRASARRSPPR